MPLPGFFEIYRVCKVMKMMKYCRPDEIAYSLRGTPLLFKFSSAQPWAFISFSALGSLWAATTSRFQTKASAARAGKVAEMFESAQTFYETAPYE